MLNVETLGEWPVVKREFWDASELLNEYYPDATEEEHREKVSALTAALQEAEPGEELKMPEREEGLRWLIRVGSADIPPPEPMILLQRFHGEDSISERFDSVEAIVKRSLPDASPTDIEYYHEQLHMLICEQGDFSKRIPEAMMEALGLVNLDSTHRTVGLIQDIRRVIQLRLNSLSAPFTIIAGRVDGGDINMYGREVGSRRISDNSYTYNP